jgi:hypothetical protein
MKIRHLSLTRPPEIRLLVFEHLMNDQQMSFEANQQSPKSKGGTTTSRINQAIRALIPPPTPLFHAMTLVNRCVREEFLQIYYQKALFRFTLDASHADTAPFWKVPNLVLSSMRTVRLKILANPGIVGEFDPRRVTGSWNLRDRVFGLIDDMHKLEDLRLSIQACGNQLWNPIWLWHYTSQAFKVSEVKAFKRMSFDLEGWNMREPNHLERNEDGLWDWRCADNHFVQLDTDGPQPIRSFCAALYAECRICDRLEVPEQSN